MVDFNKIRMESKARALDAANKIATAPKKASYLDRINNLIKNHLGNMTEWEANFCYSNKNFMVAVPDKENLPHILTEKVKSKIAELEALYSGE